MIMAMFREDKINRLGIRETQHEIIEWSRKNFGQPVPIALDISSLLGVVEEVGELAHSILKLSQGIRGTPTEHMANIEDAVGDILVYLFDFCSRNGMDAEDILRKVWGRVKERDWQKDKEKGGEV